VLIENIIRELKIFRIVAEKYRNRRRRFNLRINGSRINVMLSYLCGKKIYRMNCSHCGSTETKKNGLTHYGKQRYMCHICNRQFVEGGQDWFVSDEEKALINKLLLERISLNGICRVCNVSESWLLRHVKELYSNLPDDLNADLEVGDIESYLETRMDEEITRISCLKKIRLHLKNMLR